MGKKRQSLGFDDDIDIGELSGTRTTPPTDQQYRSMQAAGEKYGFTHREPKKKKPRARSPYVVQKNIKMRIGMPELLEELTAIGGWKTDQETLEYAIRALIERGGFEDLMKEFKKLTDK